MSASDKPITGPIAQSFAERYAIATHPAFRLGFLDAQAGKPLDHDRIIDRIAAETPKRALERLGWKHPQAATLFHMDAREVSVAQYRYEEGRLAVIAKGARCKAWGHPDYPPKQVMDLCFDGPKATPPPPDRETPNSG
jgi:hypothetical protein